MIVVRLHELTAAARAGLAETIDKVLEADLEHGRAELYELDAGASYAVVRVESDLDELVVCAYRGRDVAEFFALCAARAEVLGLRSVRFHTRRPALQRLMRRAGYPCELAELVYRIPIEEGACH